jgi:hypothetical protein
VEIVHGWILRDAVDDVDLDVKKAFKGFLF